MDASRAAAQGRLIALALVAMGLACSPVAAVRSRGSGDFDCPPHRLTIRTEGIVGDEPLDRRAIRADLRAQRREDPVQALEVVDFVIEGCGHYDRYVCHRRGPGRPFECGVMIR